MTRLMPEKLYTAEQVRELDRKAIEMTPITGFELMKKAGRTAFRSLLCHWPRLASCSVFCGGGNNGGDGLVIAVLAAQKGVSVELLLLADPELYRGEAASAWKWLKQEMKVINELQGNEKVEFKIKLWLPGDGMTGEVIIDCLLGTGLSGNVRGVYLEAIDAVNQSKKPVLAVDIPSGVCSDTGRVLGCAIRADHTITFIGVKQGLLTGQAPNYVGELEFNSLGVSGEVYQETNYSCLRADWHELKRQIPRRSRVAHKGEFGRVLVIGGDHGMGGAALMAAEAACKVGAGLVYAATRSEHVVAFIANRPEVMAKAVDITQHVESMIGMVDIIVIGPGLGRQAWGQQLLQNALSANKPMVIDADGLNLLAEQQVVPRDNWILTPHPGEAARLLKCSVQEIEQDRFKAVTKLQKKYGGSVILKGAGTLISCSYRKKSVSLWLANTGNPGMATGGMGDVLSGLLGGMLAQHAIDNNIVAPAAVTLHGEAANWASKVVGEYSLLASDVITAIPELLREN